ncbi:hypothetical protein G6F40_017373 [Rhizopus arrhizus]|nr:hypothetical protein G6F40_017373 [Rhizopus arrhizus]
MEAPTADNDGVAAGGGFAVGRRAGGSVRLAGGVAAGTGAGAGGWTRSVNCSDNTNRSKAGNHSLNLVEAVAASPGAPAPHTMAHVKPGTLMT